MGCQTFRVKMVDAEFSTELNEDRIAPNITAAKKPISGLGSTFIARKRVRLVSRHADRRCPSGRLQPAAGTR